MVTPRSGTEGCTWVQSQDPARPGSDGRRLRARATAIGLGGDGIGAAGQRLEAAWRRIRAAWRRRRPRGHRLRLVGLGLESVDTLPAGQEEQAEAERHREAHERIYRAGP